MIQTADKAIETVRALPNAERAKFFDWAEEEIHKKSAEKQAKKAELERKNERFRRALRWIDENKEEFDGQWVCLDGDKLIAHGKDAKAVYGEAKAKGIETPFMERIKANELPFGGW
ncbi:MAG TPA: DUF5678 domain-containing protein [Pyrinomonadaceae bacterium]|nr:DUF5678 domain-containing protein [Pyrinomonadaceae bacterium]